MDIKRLPPSILVALGLAGCGPTVSPDDDTVGDGSTSEGTSTTGDVSTSACLDVQPMTTEMSSDVTSGPCLGQDLTTTGPCLAPMQTTGSESGSGSGSGSESGSGSGSGSSDSGSGSDESGSVGPCLAPPGDAPGEGGATAMRGATARAAILDKMLAAGVLPPDVAAKLKA